MSNLRQRIIRALMVFSCTTLPLWDFVHCDWRKGEFEIDLERLGINVDDDGVNFDLW